MLYYETKRHFNNKINLKRNLIRLTNLMRENFHENRYIKISDKFRRIMFLLQIRDK